VPGTSANPVFVGGVNRSGTSLVRQILGSHPDLAMPPSEFEFFKRLTVPLRSRLTTEQTARLVDDVLAWPKVAGWGLERARVEAFAGEGEGSVRSVFVAVLRAYAAQLGKPRFGEKTTYYERHLRTFDRWFGRDYAFVHLLRHPVATYASTRNYGGREHAIDPHAWARQWSNSALVAARAARARATGYAVLRYEDVVADPEGEIRRACAVAALPFDVRMLAMPDFAQKENSSFELAGAAYAGTVRTHDTVDRASRIPAAELAVVRSRCALAAALVGYDVDDEHRRLPFVAPYAPAREWRARVAVRRSTGADLARRLPRRLIARAGRR